MPLERAYFTQKLKAGLCDLPVVSKREVTGVRQGHTLCRDMLVYQTLGEATDNF